MAYSIETKEISTTSYKFYITEDGVEIGRSYLYIMQNDLHKEPLGYLEDVFVSESHRGKGIGTLLIKKVLEKAKSLGCYKLTASSRFSREGIHKWYESLGFSKTGYNFRFDF